MRRTPVALALAVLAVVPVPGARAQAQAPGPELFAVQPQTPAELWDAIHYLIRTGQADRAVPYLRAFQASNPTDEVLLELRETYGPGSFLRLNDDPATRPFAGPLLEAVNAAANRNATRAERIRQHVGQLSASREEQEYALAELRRAGPYAVPYIIEELRSPRLSESQRRQVAQNLGRLDRAAVPPLIAVLDAPDVTLAAVAAEALGQIGDPRAIAPLTVVAARPDELDAARAAARRAIGRLTGRPFEAQPRGSARRLADEARLYLAHKVAFPTDPVELWRWDDGPRPEQVSADEAEGILGLHFAREALRLAPEDPDAQATATGLMLGKAVERAGGLANFPGPDLDGAFAQAQAAGPAVLAEVLRRAIADGQSELAAAAAFCLGRVTDRDVLPTDPRPHPLVQAVSAPDRRVQMAAARALVDLQPRRPFPGSDRVVPALARFAANQAAPRAVIISSDERAAAGLVGMLAELGLEAQVANSGEQGFRLAADYGDVEAIFIVPGLVRGNWGLNDTLSNLRADSRTAGVPILLVGPIAEEMRLGFYLDRYPRTAFLVAPARAEDLRRPLSRALNRMGVFPLTEGERVGFAREATGLLAQVASTPGSPFEPDLPRATAALALALANPATSLSAAVALADIPDPEAQRRLADVLLDPGRPAPFRLAVADRLGQSLRRFGPLLRLPTQRSLIAARDEATDPPLRAALSEVVGSLRPAPTAVGRRLQTYEPPAPSSVSPETPPEVPPAAPGPDAGEAES